MNMAKPYSIIVSSQKGGVGKTTISVNLATALRQRGYKVLLVDADYSNPCVGFHLGLEGANAGLRSVVTGKAKLEDVVALHNPTGLHVLTGEISAKPFHPDLRQNRKLYNELERSSYNFVVIDMAPGTSRLGDVMQLCCENSREVLIVLTPEMSACSSAIRLAGFYEKMHVPHSILANRVKNRRYELAIGEIEDAVGENLVATLPEDENVPISIAQHIPVVVLMGRSSFSVAAKELARKISNKVDYSPGESAEKASGSGGGFVSWLMRLLGWRR